MVFLGNLKSYQENELPEDRFNYDHIDEDIFIETSLHRTDSSIGFIDVETQTLEKEVSEIEVNTDTIAFINNDQETQTADREMLETVKEDASPIAMENAEPENDEIMIQHPTQTAIKLSKMVKKKARIKSHKDSAASKSPHTIRERGQSSVSPSQSKPKASSGPSSGRGNTVFKNKLIERSNSRNEEITSQQSESVLGESLDSNGVPIHRSKSEEEKNSYNIVIEDSSSSKHPMNSSIVDIISTDEEKQTQAILIDKDNRSEEVNSKLEEVEALNALIKERANKLRDIEKYINQRTKFIDNLKVDIEEFQSNQAAIELSPKTIRDALPSPLTILKSFFKEYSSSRPDTHQPDSHNFSFANSGNYPDSSFAVYAEAAITDLSPPKETDRSNSSTLKNTEISRGNRVKTIPPINQYGIDFSNFDPIQEGLVPTGADIVSWQAGYSLGYDTGKSAGYQDGEEIGYERGTIDGMIKSTKETGDYSRLFEEESDDELNNSVSSSKDLKNKAENYERSSNPSPDRLPGSESRKRPRHTKFSDFRLARPETRYRREHPSTRLLERILSKDISKMSKYIRYTRKMLYKQFVNAYQTIIFKQKSGEIVKYLSCFIYDDFMQKYGLKKVADRKFTDFVVSILSFFDARRVSMFGRLFGIGHKLEVENYSSHSFRLYKNCLAHIYNSKAGIIINLEETADKQMIPTIRALECTRENTAQFLSPVGVQKLIMGLEKFAIPDPKRINPSGLIEQELVLEVIIDSYQEFQGCIRKNISGLVNCFTLKVGSKLISKNFLGMIMRYISCNKSSCIFSKIDDENETVLAEMKKHLIILPEDEKNSMYEEMNGECFPVPKLTDYCIKNCIFTQSDLESFLGLSLRTSSNILDTHIQTAKSEVTELLQSAQAQAKQLDKMRSRLQHLDEKSHQFSKIYILATWKIHKNELNRLLSLSK